MPESFTNTDYSLVAPNTVLIKIRFFQILNQIIRLKINYTQFMLQSLVHTVQ